MRGLYFFKQCCCLVLPVSPDLNLGSGQIHCFVLTSMQLVICSFLTAGRVRVIHNPHGCGGVFSVAKMLLNDDINIMGILEQCHKQHYVSMILLLSRDQALLLVTLLHYSIEYIGYNIV